MQVGDHVFQTYQTEVTLERATTLEFAIISPICSIHACAKYLLIL